MERPSSSASLDAEAVAALYQQYAPTLLAYLRRRAASWEDAEDLLLEVFLAAVEREQVFFVPEEGRLAWLQRVAQHKLVDQYRRSTRRTAMPLDAAAATLAEDEARGPEQLALRHEAHQELHQALQRLPASYQEVLRLRFANDLRCAEIGAALGKPEGAIRVLLWRALNHLRARYDEHRGGGRE
jgi:RNA polymerase sigma-70 factor (ECF subfamily)